MAKLKGRVAIVTGAGRPANIGEAVCAAFLDEGASGVIATDLRDGEAQALAERFGSESFAFLPHDVALEADWQRVVAATLERFGGLGILNRLRQAMSGA